jgi:hypothetical protein
MTQTQNRAMKTNNNTNNEQSFGTSYYPCKSCFKLADKTKAELYDMAEYFNQFTKEDLQDSLHDLDNFWNRMTGVTKKRDEVVDKLYPYVREVQSKMSDYQKTLKANKNDATAKQELDRLRSKAGRVLDRFFTDGAGNDSGVSGYDGAKMDDVYNDTVNGIY